MFDSEAAVIAFVTSSSDVLLDRVSTEIPAEKTFPFVVLAVDPVSTEQGTETGEVIAQTVRVQASIYGSTKVEASDTALALSEFMSTARNVDVVGVRIRSIDVGPVRYREDPAFEPSQPRYVNDFTVHTTATPTEVTP